MRTIEFYVEGIVKASKEVMHFINFEIEDLETNQKFPVVGALANTGGFTEGLKRRIQDVSIVYGTPVPRRVAEDTTVTYTRKQKIQEETMKEYIVEIVELLTGDDLNLPFKLNDDLLFASNVEGEILYVKGDFAVEELAKNNRAGGFIDVDKAADNLDC